MANSTARRTNISGLVLAAIVIWLIAAASCVFADDGYYQEKTIYTEGIYITDGIYVEPCFEHFKGQDKKVPALKVEGDMPEGTEYILYEHKGTEYVNKYTDVIPEISSIGVYRIDVKMPGSAPATFQAEIVLEGLQPCEKIVGEEPDEIVEGAPAYDGVKFTGDPSRETYNIVRGENCGSIPSYNRGNIAMYHYSDNSQMFDISNHVRRFVTTGPHTMVTDFEKTPFGEIKLEHVSLQLYEKGFRFATDEEMKVNREK